MHDNITKPAHYCWHPSGVEAKEVTDDLPRWLGDAITYIWRRNHKGQPIDDRRKAIERLNEATPERLIQVMFSIPVSVAFSAEKINPSPDHLLYTACLFITVANTEYSYLPVQELMDQLKADLQAELDELTANEAQALELAH